MNDGDWRLWCNVLKNRLDSYGLTVVLPVRVLEVPHARLKRLLAEPRRHGLLTVPGLTPCPHLTLAAVTRSRFSLPQELPRRTMCRELLAFLADSLPVRAREDKAFQRLRIAAETPGDCLSELAEREKAWLQTKRLTRIAEPPTTGPEREITFSRCSLELSESGAVFILLKESEFLLEYESTLISGFGVSTPKRPESHLTLGHACSPRAYRFLADLLQTPSSLRGLRLAMGSPRAVAYAHRSLGSVLRVYVSGSGELPHAHRKRI